MSARTLTLTDGTIQHRFSVLGHDRLVCAIAPNGTVAEYDGMDGHEHLVRETTANGCVSHYLHDRLYQINLMGGAVVHLAGGAPHEYVTRIENVSMTPLAQGASDAIDELDELGDHCSDEAAQALTAHLEELRVLADGTGTTHYYGHGAINSRGFCGDQRLPRPVRVEGVDPAPLKRKLSEVMEDLQCYSEARESGCDEHALVRVSKRLKEMHDIVGLYKSKDEPAIDDAVENSDYEREVFDDEDEDDDEPFEPNDEHGIGDTSNRHEVLRAVREAVLAAVTSHGCALEYVVESLKSDREVVLAAVKAHGCALEYVVEPLKSDREVVMAAVKSHGHALEYVVEPLKSDREVVMEAVKSWGYALEYVVEPLKSDREVVMAAMKTHGCALMHVVEPLKSDREVVMEAVKSDGCALEYVVEPLKSDREVVLAASRAVRWSWRQ